PGFPQPDRSSIPEGCFCTAIARFRAGRSRHGKKLAITGCTSLRQGAVDGRHVIEALKIICSRMRLTLKAGECTYRESFNFLDRAEAWPCEPHSMLSTQE